MRMAAIRSTWHARLYEEQTRSNAHAPPVAEPAARSTAPSQLAAARRRRAVKEHRRASPISSTSATSPHATPYATASPHHSPMAAEEPAGATAAAGECGASDVPQRPRPARAPQAAARPMLSVRAGKAEFEAGEEEDKAVGIAPADLKARGGGALAAALTAASPAPIPRLLVAHRAPPSPGTSNTPLRPRR